jgi:two-component sensor histidine kinase
MKTVKLLRQIIYSSWFLAAIPAILIMLLLPRLGSKYRLEVVPAELYDCNNTYADLNSDSTSEILTSGKGIPFYFISLKNIDHLYYDQWNISDSVSPLMSKMFFGNYDHDRYSEIYLFSWHRDSLFLNVNEILKPGGGKPKRIFITNIGYHEGHVTATVHPAGFYDENRDGSDELYFSLSSAFQMGPREICCYDFVNKTLKSSPFGRSTILFPVLEDADGDQKPEVFGTSSASGNYPSNVPYSDSSAWFMVLDSRLNFKFPPVEFRGFANGLFTYAYKSGEFRGYVTSYLANGADTTVLPSSIQIYAADGTLVRYRLFNQFSDNHDIRIFVRKAIPSDRIFLFGNKFYELNNELAVIRTVTLPFHNRFNLYTADMDGDGEDEYLLYSDEEKKLAVYSPDFHRYMTTDFDMSESQWSFSPYFTKDHKYKLYISSGGRSYFTTIRKNDYYLAAYLVHPAIYFACFFFILLIKRIGRNQQKAREDLNNRLITLQLQGIKAQLDPHFTFNTLNSIASLIYLEDRQTAYDYMRKFTELLRSMLNDAEKIYRNLSEEIEFVTTYLDLEKLRFGQKFTYVIEVGSDVNLRNKVPKLVLQTFAENAVKHGIMPAEKGGLITIRISNEHQNLKLSVEDNGIGRSNSAGKSNSTGKGLKLTSEFYEILNQINRKPIKYHITDLHDDTHEPSGTRVEVWVPIEEL